MPSYFSLTRFLRLFNEHWIKTWRPFAILTLLLAAILAGALAKFELQGHFYIQKYNDVQRSIFDLGAFLFAFGYALHWYYTNWHKTKKVTILSLPVSGLERTLLSLLWLIPLFAIWYLSLFQSVNFIMFKWATNYELQTYRAHSLENQNPFHASTLLSLSDIFSVRSLLISLLIQSLFFASLLWFRSFAVIKALVTTFVLIAVYLWYQTYFIPNWLTPEYWIYIGDKLRLLTNFDFSEYNEIQSSPILSGINRFHLIIAGLALWILIHFRIKEQEV